MKYLYIVFQHERLTEAIGILRILLLNMALNITFVIVTVGLKITTPVLFARKALEHIRPWWEVYGPFWPKTLRTQDISAPCVWCRNVSHFCVGAEVSIDTSGTEVHETLARKCMRHFGPRIKICFECVKNVEPLYIRYSNGLKVLRKRLTKVVSSLLHVSRSRIVGNEHNRSGSRGMQLQWAEMRHHMWR